MPRLPRVDVSNQCYHVLNRANARLPIYFEEADYILFENILIEAADKFKMRVLNYCLMPNHFHLVLHPRQDGDLARFMQWLTLTHTQRWHAKNQTTGTGHIYQGRYKSFLIQNNNHLLAVIRYVERNPLRAKLVTKAENWRFNSLWIRLHGRPEQKKFLSPWPIPEPSDYLDFVNTPLDSDIEETIRQSITRDRPLGNPGWTDEMIEKYKLEKTTRPRGRPKKK